MPSTPAKQYQRVVTHLDVWSATKLSFLFYIVVALMWIAAGVILWNVMAAFGWIEKIEGVIGNLATGSFRLHSGAVLRAGLIIAGVFVLGMTLLTTLLVLIYNLISDVVGGLGFRVEDRGARQARVASFTAWSRRRVPVSTNGKDREAKPAPSRGRRKPAPAGARTRQKTAASAAGAKTVAAPARSGATGAPKRARPAASGAQPGVSTKKTGQRAKKKPPQTQKTRGARSASGSETPPGTKRKDSSSVAPLPSTKKAT